jgi:hypothetical protein
MFTVAMFSGCKWAVQNEAGDLTFTGTMRDCEDWLDCRENEAREAARIAPRRPTGAGRPRLNLQLKGLRRPFDSHHKLLLH